MHFTAVPADAKGEWIWLSESLNRLESYVFFRREFMLMEAPGVAEVWLAAHGTCHLFINGRYFCRGSAPAIGRRSGVAYFEVGHCMEIGKNVISAIVHNTRISRYNGLRRQGGFWLQLNADQEPLVWTDQEWFAKPGECFETAQPRTDLAGSFVENLDFRKYPMGWQQPSHDTDDWQLADYSMPLENPETAFFPTPDFEPIPERISLDFVEVRGTLKHVAASTHVWLSRHFHRPGLFAAETFIQSDGAELDFQLFCDDPYYFFVNGQLVKKQGDGGDPSEWRDPSWQIPRGYMQDQIADVSGQLTLQEGWNHLLVVQQIERDSAALTINFPQLSPAKTRFTRGTDAFALPGWHLVGPLRVPFANVTASLALERLERTVYHGIVPADTAANLFAYEAKVDETFTRDGANGNVEELELEAGQYVVFTLNKYTRGCPELAFTGSDGDVIDIVYGDHIYDGRVLPYYQDHRKIYTVTLKGNRTCIWQSIAPCGLQHLMVVVRDAHAKVRISNMAVLCMRFSFRQSGSFNSSDELLNQIWKTTINTLEGTYDYTFLNSAGQHDGQLLADAFIQSLACLFTFGNADLSEKTLREFAASQYETGEIPAIAPSDFSVRLYDFSLLWPIWLQKHLHYTDDRQLAEDMMPHLDDLLGFFETIATCEEVLIANLQPPFTLPCLLDYDSNLDLRGVPTGLNALYCLCLLKCEWLYNYAGRPDAAKVCHRRAALIADRLRAITWNAEKGLFADCWFDGQLSDRHSFQSNVLALYAGIVPPEQAEGLFNKIVMEYAPFLQLPCDQSNENPYFKFFLVDMAFALNARDWALDYLRYYWGKMTQEGATSWWERFCPEIEFTAKNTPGLCHGYGVSPSYFLSREVIGLRPVQAGFLQVYFNPLLTAAEWVRAKVPTPQGEIMVEWGFNPDGDLEIVLNASFPLEVVPQLDSAISASAVFHVNDNVSILQSAD